VQALKGKIEQFLATTKTKQRPNQRRVSMKKALAKRKNREGFLIVQRTGFLRRVCHGSTVKKSRKG
jgi:hypothetical protein